MTRPCSPRSRMMASAVTDLPEPLSPTMPTISPSRTLSETSSSTGTEPRGVGRRPTGPRSRAVRHRPLSGSVQPRVQDVAQPVAQEVEADDRDAEHGARRQGEVRIGAQRRPGRHGSCRPSVGIGSCTPRPRKLSVASAMMMKPMPTDARTISGGTMLGRRCRSRMVSGRVPRRSRRRRTARSGARARASASAARCPATRRSRAPRSRSACRGRAPPRPGSRTPAPGRRG